MINVVLYIVFHNELIQYVKMKIKLVNIVKQVTHDPFIIELVQQIIPVAAVLQKKAMYQWLLVLKMMAM